MDNQTHFLKFAQAFLQNNSDLPADFKRRLLPRVKKPLGMIKGLCPASILDIGYGRGAFLYPLLEQNPNTYITILDNDPFKISILNQLNSITNLHPVLGDINSLPFEDDFFDVVTALEILEHQENPYLTAKEILRVAKNFVIISVPSKPDNNPQHLHLLKQKDVQNMFNKKVSFNWVNGHMIVLIRVHDA